MIRAEQITEIISQYTKHGWNLSRVLLCRKTSENLPVSEIFGDVPVNESNIDAAWFSRPSKNEREAWELRHLSENPFALFETFGKNDGEEYREKIKKEMETRLKKQASGKDG